MTMARRGGRRSEILRRRAPLARAVLFVAALVSAAALLCAGAALATAADASLPRGLQPMRRGDTAGASELSQRFIAALEQSDGRALLGVIHAEALVDRASVGLAFVPAQRALLAQGMTAMLGELGALLAARAPAGIALSHRGLFERGDRMHALIRLDLGERRLGYLELRLARTPEGRVVVYDWYDYAHANDYSARVRQLGQLSSGDPLLVASALGLSDVDQAAAEQGRRFMLELQLRDHAGALATLRRVPDAMRVSKPMLLERVRLATLVASEPEQQRALAELGNIMAAIRAWR